MSNLTEQAIKASFRKLLNERPLTRITVRDIASVSGINRNTFYYHYHDIPELMEELIRDDAAALIDAYPDISSLDECVETAFHFIVENRKSIHHIYHSVNREVLERYLMRICDYTVSTWYDSVSAARKTSNHDRERILRFIRYELFGACIDFLNEDMPPEAIGEAKNLMYLCLEVLEREVG